MNATSIMNIEERLTQVWGIPKENFIINGSGIVDMSTTCFIHPRTLEHHAMLGVQFGTIEGAFDITDTHIGYLKGFPKVIKGNAWLHRSDINNFSGIDRIVKQIHGVVSFNYGATHLLGFILLEGKQNFQIDDDRLGKILTKYSGTGDILSAQDELLDAGYVREARL